MPALSAITQWILILPLFFNNHSANSHVLSPLASGEILGISTFSNQSQQQTADQQYQSLIGEIIKNDPININQQNHLTTPDVFPKTFKGNIKILTLGSTQVNQLQNGEGLITKLGKYYPNIKFEFINYASDHSDINYALAKTNDTFINNNTLQSSVIFQEPDILLVDTFGYDQDLSEKTQLESHLQKLNNIINIVFSYNKSQNIFISNFAPNSASYSNIHTDANLQYASAAKTLNNINSINLAIQNNHLPLIDLTNTYPDLVTNDNLKITPLAVSTMEDKIVEYLVNNQTIDTALQTQKNQIK